MVDFSSNGLNTLNVIRFGLVQKKQKQPIIKFYTLALLCKPLTKK